MVGMKGARGWLVRKVLLNEQHELYAICKKEKSLSLSPGKNTQKTNTQKNTVGMKHVKNAFQAQVQ